MIKIKYELERYEVKMNKVRSGVYFSAYIS